MTVEDKISQLNHKLSSIDSLTIDSIEELKAKPKQTVSYEQLNKSAAKIRKSVIKLSREFESHA